MYWKNCGKKVWQLFTFQRNIFRSFCVCWNLSFFRMFWGYVFHFFFLLKFWFGFFIGAFQFNQKKTVSFFLFPYFYFLHVILQFDHIVIVCIWLIFSETCLCDNRVCHNSTIEFDQHIECSSFFVNSHVYVCKCSLRPLARTHAPCPSMLIQMVFNWAPTQYRTIQQLLLPRRLREWWHRSKYKSFSIFCVRHEPIHSFSWWW